MSPTDEPVPAPASLWWSVPAVAVVLLLLLVLFVGRPPEPIRPGTTIDAKAGGVRGPFLVLEESGVPVRASRRPAEGRVRWLLFPGEVGKGLPALRDWVRAGGRLVLADDRDDHARALGVPARLAEGDARPVIIPFGPAAGGALALEPDGPTWRATDPPARSWPTGADEPLASVFSLGRGEVWVVHHPRFLLNERLRTADHAVLLVRLGEASSGPDRERLYIDDHAHGLVDRPGVVELLLTPPALWTTLGGVALLGLVLWRNLPRFGPLRPPPPAGRRSKDEFLGAMAHLLERKRAYREAYRTCRDALVRDLAVALQLPPETPAEGLAEIAARRVPTLAPDRLAEALARRAPPDDPVTFLRHLAELARIRREYFHG